MLKGKTAIITGGSRGIGAAIGEKFASLGVNLAILYGENRALAQKLCQEWESRYGILARAWQCDVSSFQETKNTVAAIRAEFGTVDILVNNAGITRDGLVATMSEETFDAVLDVNLKGAFHMIRHCAGAFLRAGGGCIINISSVSGILGNAGQANYSASKAGLLGLTKAVARELASRNIRCNAIAPGFIGTDMTDSQGQNPLLSQIPLGRMGTPEDVAEAAAYLADAKYVTGVTLRIDGGLAIGGM